MKILKKLFSMLLSLLLLGDVTTLCGIFVVRNILSGSNIIDLALKNVGNVEIVYGDILTDLTGEKVFQEMDKYLDSEGLQDSLETYINDTLKYYGGINGVEMPSTEVIKKQVLDSVKKYEDATGMVVDHEKITSAFEKLDEEIASEVGVTDNPEIKKVLNFIYSNQIVFFLIGMIVGCILLKFLVTRNFISLIKDVMVVAILNSLGNWGFGVALKNVFNTVNEEQVHFVVASFTSSFYKVATISGIVAGIFILLLIVLKLISKHKGKKEDSTIEHLDENLENENI